ncbi:MAG: hypothetical protein GX639_11590 [Fibrobacter sp.]|nr:hypothetical protein [Fibrobacter sp.]
MAFELDEIEDLLEKIIDKHEGSINISNLKNQILQIDNAFNEKQMGFKNFTSFIDSLDFLKHEKDMVSYRRPSVAATSYKTLLKRKNWDFLPKTMSINCIRHVTESQYFPDNKSLINWWQKILKETHQVSSGNFLISFTNQNLLK